MKINGRERDINSRFSPDTSSSEDEDAASLEEKDQFSKEHYDEEDYEEEEDDDSRRPGRPSRKKNRITKPESSATSVQQLQCKCYSSILCNIVMI
jgi:hypothetical protein